MLVTRICALALVLVGSPAARAATLSNVTVGNLTPDGFTIAWQASEASVPDLAFFLDEAGSIPLPWEPILEINPLGIGNVSSASTVETRQQRRDLIDSMQSRNIALIRVSDLSPGQTLYVQPLSLDPDTLTSNLSESAPLLKVSLPEYTDFVLDAQLLAVDFSALDATGMVAVLSGPDGFTPITAVVGDAHDPDIALFNLSEIVETAIATNAAFEGSVDFSIRVIGAGATGGTLTHELVFTTDTIPSAFSAVAFFLGGEDDPAFFVFDPIPDQDAGLAFIITIRAMTAENQPMTSYAGTVTLAGSVDLGLGGGSTPAFTNGVLTQTVRIDQGGVVTLSAVDGWSAGSSNSFGVRDNFSAWRNDSFGEDASSEEIAGLLADPDNSGLVNLIRYGYQLGGTRPDRSKLPQYGRVQEDGQDYLTVTFNRLTEAADIAYIVESSDDLRNWDHVATVLPGLPQTVTVQDIVPLTGRFRSMRVGISQRLSFASFMNLHAPESVRNDPQLVGPSADPGNQGITNLERYAFGLNYLNPSPAGLPSVTTIEDAGQTYLQITFNRLQEGANVEYIVQAGDTTNGWTTIEVFEPGMPSSVTVRDTEVFMGGSSRTMRVVVQLVP